MIKSDKPSGLEETWSHEAFGFVQMLAEELSEGRVQLPGIPEVALRVQRVLVNERSDVDMIVQAVSAEPTLAMQIMRMANSVAFNTTGQSVQDIRAAVQRVGSRLVHAAALAFIVQQLRGAEDLRQLRDPLNALWRRGVIVAAIGKALAGQLRTVAPDAALLAGLLHVVGRLYILTRLSRLPQLFDQPHVAERIMEDWGGHVGKAVLENWELPDEFGEAVAAFNDPDREFKGAISLTDVLAAANILADLLPPSRSDYLDQVQLANVYLQTERLWQRLRLGRENCSDALHIALADVQQLRALFGA